MRPASLPIESIRARTVPQRGILLSKVIEEPKPKEEPDLYIYSDTFTGKLNFWQRLVYLFTGKRPNVKSKKPIVSTEDAVKFLDENRPKEYAASYTTFAGCDAKPIMVSHTPSRDLKEILKKADDRANRIVPGTIQAISFDFREEFIDGAPVSVTAGTVICVMFNDSAIHTLDLEGEWDLVLKFADQYSSGSVMVLPRFRITSYQWGISIDDLVSEETMSFEADRPIYLTKVR